MSKVRVLIVGLPKKMDGSTWIKIRARIQDHVVGYLTKTTRLEVMTLALLKPGTDQSEYEQTLLTLEATVLFDGRFSQKRKDSILSAIAGQLELAAIQHCPKAIKVAIQSFHADGPMFGEPVTYEQ